MAAIAAGDDRLAYEIARLPNPFPSICGRVCAAPCEIACRRGSIDQPIAIRALKRFVVRTVRGGEPARTGGVRGGCPDRAGVRSERVAIIGAGPAGWRARTIWRRTATGRWYSKRSGEAGGMMVLGIPPYRLRRDLLDAEIRAILDDGRRAPYRGSAR